MTGFSFRISCFRFLILLLFIVLAACGGGRGPSGPPPASVSTLAYVVTRCHEEKGGAHSSFNQAVWVRQGEQSPVKIAEFAFGQPPIGGLCALFGRGRNGDISSIVGAFQRIDVTPDGAQVVIEVTEDFSIFPPVVPAEQKGIFLVRADGSGLHRIAAPSRDPLWRIDWGCVFAGGSCLSYGGGFDFSPDGRRVVYTDRGPSHTGDEAPQIVTLDIVTGQRQQVTHLPALPVCSGQSSDSPDCVQDYIAPLSVPSFLDDATIAYVRGKGDSTFGGGLFTVEQAPDGSWGEPEAAPVVALPGGAVVPVFQITGAEASAGNIAVPGPTPVNGPGPAGNIVREAFVIESTSTTPGGEPRVLQLTNYGRSDAGGTHMSLDQQHVLFSASADPLGTNPSMYCQWFSIDRLGGNLRQLTTFDSAGATRCNCQVECAPPSCTATNAGDLDRITGSVVFGATCDPFGTNPNDGVQVFALSPDGALRQLTQTQGIIRGPDRSIDVELPGPFAVPSRFR